MKDFLNRLLGGAGSPGGGKTEPKAEAVAKLEELPDGGVIRRTVGNREVAIFRRGEEFHAIDAQCPHRRGPLDEACLEDGHIAVCPWHGWRFDIRTGISPTHPARVLTYRTSVREGMIWVELP